MVRGFDSHQRETNIEDELPLAELEMAYIWRVLAGYDRHEANAGKKLGLDRRTFSDICRVCTGLCSGRRMRDGETGDGTTERGAIISQDSWLDPRPQQPKLEGAVRVFPSDTADCPSL